MVKLHQGSVLKKVSYGRDQFVVPNLFRYPTASKVREVVVRSSCVIPCHKRPGYDLSFSVRRAQRRRGGSDDVSGNKSRKHKQIEKHTKTSFRGTTASKEAPYAGMHTHRRGRRRCVCMHMRICTCSAHAHARGHAHEHMHVWTCSAVVKLWRGGL